MNAAKLIATFCIFAYASHNINLAEVKSTLITASRTYFFFAFVLIGLHLVLVAIRWRSVINICGKTVSVYSAINLTLVGHFFRSLLPLSIGGDVARAVFCQKIGLSKTTALVSVIVDRILGLISLAVIVVVVSLTSESTRSIAIYGVTLVLLLLGLIASTLIISESDAMRNLNIFPTFKLNLKNVALSIKSEIYSTASLIAMTYSILANISIILSMFFLAASINCDISLIQSLIYFPIVLLMTLLPISVGGWGVREVVLIFIFSLLSLPEAQAVFISVAFGMILTFYGFVGGIVLYKLNAILLSR
jgi:uncharacterized protein (TIRG00374 family)